MLQGNELKQVILQLSEDIKSDDYHKSLEANYLLDALLKDKFDVKHISLAMYSLREKDCVKNINAFIDGTLADDFEIAKAMSSLITHLIIYSEKDIRRFPNLDIPSLCDLLNHYVAGEISRDTLRNEMEGLIR